MSQDNHFINEADEAVSDFIDGIILTYPNLQKVGNQNVIIRRNIPPNKVTLLSGGGSGHEPSHAGWIGDGMLDGAVLGGEKCDYFINRICLFLFNLLLCLVTDILVCP